MCVCVCGGGGGAVVTVDVKILCLLFFSAHAIFDDPVKVIWWQLQETDVIAHLCPLSI